MKRIYTLSKTMAFLFSCMALIGTASSCADDYNTDAARLKIPFYHR